MSDPNEITVFAKTNFRNLRREFGIKLDDRRRHMYVIGKTGMGKSTMLENMIIDDIRKGRGVAVVDPHGDLAEKIISYIPSERTNDLIYFNPADTKFPIAFNILETVGPDYKHLVAYGLVGVFKKIWADSWGPRMEYILTNTILALLDYPGSTLLGVMRMLVDKAYRKKVVARVTDPVVKTFWSDEFSNYSEKFRTEAIAPIQNKVGQFLASAIIRNIVGQSKSTIEMREIMDNEKILIMNLAKGRIGEENSALLGAMMITKLQIAAMSRVDIPEEERKDFYLYVDEFQNFATESFAGILSEARKYRLNLIMAHQYIEQLGEEVRNAVFGNVGTMIVFRVGAADALVLEPEFGPQFTAQDIVNLDKYTFILRLMIDGIATEPFSAIGLPPVAGDSQNEKDKIIRVSRERYGRPQEIVEDRIIRWSGVDIKIEKKPDGEAADAEETDESETDEELETLTLNEADAAKHEPVSNGEETQLPASPASLGGPASPSLSGPLVAENQPDLADRMIPSFDEPSFDKPSFDQEAPVVAQSEAEVQIPDVVTKPTTPEKIKWKTTELPPDDEEERKTPRVPKINIIRSLTKPAPKESAPEESAPIQPAALEPATAEPELEPAPAAPVHQSQNKSQKNQPQPNQPVQPPTPTSPAAISKADSISLRDLRSGKIETVAFSGGQPKPQPKPSAVVNQPPHPSSTPVSGQPNNQSSASEQERKKRKRRHRRKNRGAQSDFNPASPINLGGPASPASLGGPASPAGHQQSLQAKPAMQQTAAKPEVKPQPKSEAKPDKTKVSLDDII